MRLKRCKSYGDLERGQNECWKIFDHDCDKLESVTDAIIAEGLHIDIADYCGQDDDGYSSEFIIDKLHVAEFKTAFKALKGIRKNNR